MAKLLCFAALVFTSGVDALTVKKENNNDDGVSVKSIPVPVEPLNAIKDMSQSVKTEESSEYSAEAWAKILAEEEARIFPELEVQLAVEGKPVVQVLRSDEGMAYYGSMYVGGQEQVGIYDTGSFEFVIESNCLTSQKKVVEFANVRKLDGEMGNKVSVPKCCSAEKCPHAKYNTKLSGKNYQAPWDILNSYDQITYGSGAVIVKSASDHVSVSDETNGKTAGNKIAAAHMPLKVIVDHEVDLFKTTEMTAIIGVGPGKFSERKDRLVHHLGVRRFMVCFQENAKKNGFWTWHDRDRSMDKQWMSVPVAGKMFWAVPTSKFTMGGEDVGCRPSCGGIIDTGTSLFTPPQAVIDKIKNKITSGSIEDCSDISKFPTFSFKLGEHKMSLPPSAYIADAGVQQVQVFRQQLAILPLPMNKRDLATVKAAQKAGEEPPAVHSCVLLLSPGDDSEQTQFGPMVIFGMSLFRKYAVQFDLSGDYDGKKDKRFMRFAEAAHDCSGPVTGGEFRRTGKLQKVNLDKIRMNPLQRRIIESLRSNKVGLGLRRKALLRI